MKQSVEQALENMGRVYTLEAAEMPVDWEDPLDVSFASPIAVKAEYVFDGKAVIFQGTIHADIQAQCGSCLKEFLYSMDIPFADAFSREPDEEEGEYGFDGEEVLLDKMILDEISLHLPVRFLCREDCKGLCPICGKDRNAGPCGCKPNGEVKKDNPFEKLKGLFD